MDEMRSESDKAAAAAAAAAGAGTPPPVKKDRHIVSWTPEVRLFFFFYFPNAILIFHYTDDFCAIFFLIFNMKEDKLLREQVVAFGTDK